MTLTVRETERTAQRELLSVLRSGRRGQGRRERQDAACLAATVDAITASSKAATTTPRRPTASGHDENAGPIRAFAWPLLIQAGGLAQLSGSKLQLTKAGRKALSEPAAETLKVWTKWVNTTILDELSRIDCVKGQTGKGKRGLTAVSSRRDAVADALAECPVRALDLHATSSSRFLRASGNDFSVTRNAWDLYIGELQYGSLGYEGWQVYPR